jgi:lipopolysaccharide/colanic/teichoic acid biosynthesis glycosyltransferase
MNQRIRQTILLCDLLWIATAFTFAYALRYQYLGFGIESWTSFRDFIPAVSAALLIWVFLYLSKDLDGFTGGWHLPTVLSQIMVAVLYLMAFLLALAFLQKHYYSRLLLIYLACLLPIGLTLIRCLARWVIASRSWNGAIRRTVILGSGHLAHELAYKISRHPELLLEVVGLLYPSSSDSSNGATIPTHELTSLPSLRVHNLLQEKNVKELIVVMPQPAGSDAERVISKCREAGMVVRLVPPWYELYVSEAQMIEVDGLPLISLEERNIPAVALALKRTVDLAGGLFLLLATSPLLLVSIIKLRQLHRRALIKESRCGAFGSIFPMLRLNVNRESLSLDGFEKLLARLSLTELPQLWNVLRGEMSLVGPRPEPPERVRHYSDWQRQRLGVKPGLTGLAQVHGLREQHSSEEKARFDLEYIFHWSLFLDFSLILQTAWTLTVRLLKPRYLNEVTSRVATPSAFDANIEEILHADRSQSSAD